MLYEIRSINCESCLYKQNIFSKRSDKRLIAKRNWLMGIEIRSSLSRDLRERWPSKWLVLYAAISLVMSQISLVLSRFMKIRDKDVFFLLWNKFWLCSYIVMVYNSSIYRKKHFAWIMLDNWPRSWVFYENWVKSIKLGFLQIRENVWFNQIQGYAILLSTA